MLVTSKGLLRRDLPIEYDADLGLVFKGSQKKEPGPGRFFYSFLAGELAMRGTCVARILGRS